MSRCECALQKDCRGARLMRWEHWKVQTAPVSQPRAVSAAAPLALFAPQWLRSFGREMSPGAGLQKHAPPTSSLPCALSFVLDPHPTPRPSVPAAASLFFPPWPWLGSGHPSFLDFIPHQLHTSLLSMLVESSLGILACRAASRVGSGAIRQLLGKGVVLCFPAKPRGSAGQGGCPQKTKVIWGNDKWVNWWVDFPESGILKSLIERLLGGWNMSKL